MATITTTTNQNPYPSAPLTYPYLAFHIHTDQKTVVIWFVLSDNFGVVMTKIGALVPDSVTEMPRNPVNFDPVTMTNPDNDLVNTPWYWIPSEVVFKSGYRQSNVVSQFNTAPYSGTVTITQ